MEAVCNQLCFSICRPGIRIIRYSTRQVHYGIDTLKAEVPIWKKEWYLDSAHPPEWKENCEGCTKLILKS